MTDKPNLTPTLTRRQANPIHLYTSKEPYRIAAGRSKRPESVEDRFANAMAMIALDAQQPTSAAFVRCFVREIKIRGYAANTIGSYTAAVRSILRWFGRPPHLLSREHVKNYLEYLVDGGHSASDISVQLVAIRNAWDKFCFRDVTLGLVTPRQKRKRIVVLSRDEIRRILQAAPSLRDTLLIGLMYGSGMRVSESARLRWRDVDHDRDQVFISQGKGNADRHVQLPRQYRELLMLLGRNHSGDQFIFPGESQSDRRTDRHLSTRTVQRVVRNTCDIAGIQKNITPHSFRHAFATHSFEDGCDIRRIQTVLGHVRLETTTLYVNVAKQRTDFPSPLDRLLDQPATTLQDAAPGTQSSPSTSTSTNDASQSLPAVCAQRSANRDAAKSSRPVGHLRIHTCRDPSVSDDQYQQTRRSQIKIEITGHGRRDFLLGVTAEMPRVGFVTINLPPKETWSDVIATLPTAMQKRMEQATFYQTLQLAIANKLLKSQDIQNAATQRSDT
ncbi:MAG: tyrosine-type recombinase/integrase [Rubripirellula sp.]